MNCYSTPSIGSAIPIPQFERKTIMSEISFSVYGKPVPGGSKTTKALYDKKGKPRLTKTGRVVTVTFDDAKGNAEWKSKIRSMARYHFKGRKPFTSPLMLKTTFYVQRPQFHFRSNGELKPNAPKYPTVRPDATKLLRSTEDALSGILWIDDTQVIISMNRKLYAEGKPGSAAGPGVHIVVSEIE